MCSPGIIVSWQMAQNPSTLLSPEVGRTFSTQADFSTQLNNAGSEHSANVFVGMMCTTESEQERGWCARKTHRILFSEKNPF